MDKRIITGCFLLPQGRGTILELDRPLETRNWKHAYIDEKEYKFGYMNFFDWIGIFDVNEDFAGKELVLTV